MVLIVFLILYIGASILMHADPRPLRNPAIYPRDGNRKQGFPHIITMDERYENRRKARR